MGPRLREAIDWIGEQEVEAARRAGCRFGRRLAGETEIAGVTSTETPTGSIGFYGRPRDRRLQDGQAAVRRRRLGKASPSNSAFSVSSHGPVAFPTCAVNHKPMNTGRLTKDRERFGKRVCRRQGDSAPRNFSSTPKRISREAAADCLAGDKAFTAKLNPAYARYGDYDQLMRLEEWYGRE